MSALSGRARTLLDRGERASENVIMTVSEQQMERVPKSDLREIAQHSQNKPSPKLQPMPSNNQNMRIIQPM